MKRFLLVNSIISIVILLLIYSCTSNFIPDPIDPRLPKYTESGNNVAGAMVNDLVWKSEVRLGIFYGSNDLPYYQLYPEKDSLVITFDGGIDSRSVALKFHLSGMGITSYEDFDQLSGQKIELDGINSYASYVEYASSYANLNKGVGQIYFRSVQLDEDRYILSGTFGFVQKWQGESSMKVSYGRFDYKLSKADQ